MAVQNGFAGIWCSYAVGHSVSACLAARFANVEGSCESSPMKREAQAVPVGSAMGVCHLFNAKASVMMGALANHP